MVDRNPDFRLERVNIPARLDMRGKQLVVDGDTFAPSLTGQTYTTANVTTDRALDADNDTLAQVADTLGTLIDDLKTAGVLE